MRFLFNKILAPINSHVIDYPTPVILSYFWNFGSLAGIFLIVQLVTGIFLAMHYAPNTILAFNSVEHIMRDVNFGWLLRYCHSNGASIFLAIIYIHIGRGLYFQSFSYPRIFVWFSGIIIFLALMATAFLGYILPWGQMSFWGATVITNLASAIPQVGQAIVIWLWGGFSVENPTLNRFFTLHFLLPFIIIGLSLLHILLLHIPGSTNPLAIKSSFDKIAFYPYFYLKDFYGLIICFLLFFIIVFFYPNVLGHSDNFIRANALVTPPSIVPEWYFLPFYAILRAIPNKILGVIAMITSICILFFVPFLYNCKIKSPKFKPIFRFFFYLFISNFLLLGWLGSQHIEKPYIILGQIGSIFHFFFF